MTINAYNLDEMDGLDRCRIASRPSTPVEILRKLAEDDNAFVRFEVAKNPAATEEILERIAVNTYDGARVVATFASYREGRI